METQVDRPVGMDLLIAEQFRGEFGANTKMGKLLRGAGPVRSSEFRRIFALPRRQWEKDPDLEELRRRMTGWLRKPGGTMTLWPNQAAALRDLHDFGGLFGPQAVGKGKALITLLAPVVLDARRPMLFVPAQVRDQTMIKVLPQMARHWRLHPGLRVVGYSELSLEKNRAMLETHLPDLIILDECHMVAGHASARTRRIRRYMAAHPETRVVAVSGTVTNRSILAYAEILLWCLKTGRSPVPSDWNELQDWSRAIDVDVPDYNRLPPGALSLLCEPNEPVRCGYRRRLVETPGVVATRDDELGVSLRLHHRPVGIPDRIEGMIRHLLATWETPNGDLLTEAVEVWRHARELALGCWYRWDPPAPPQWLAARREWNAYVRDTLRTNRRGLDTPLQVWNECERTPSPPGCFLMWRATKGTFEPNTVIEWESEYVVEDAVRWLEESRGAGGGIAWVEHIGFGRRLAERAGAPYFGGGDDSSRKILDASGPIVASIAAHAMGKNLVQWSRNLITCPPTAGKTWEQLLGRTHREGQRADEVECWVYLHTEELKNAMRQALADAQYLRDTLGGAQRLLYCDRTFDI